MCKSIADDLSLNQCLSALILSPFCATCSYRMVFRLWIANASALYSHDVCAIDLRFGVRLRLLSVEVFDLAYLSA